MWPSARSLWRIGPGGVKPALLAGLGLLAGCMSPGPGPPRPPPPPPRGRPRPARRGPRARSLRADALLLVEMRLERKDVVYCRETRRPFAARSTVLAVTLEVLRVADGARPLPEPPGPGPPLTHPTRACHRRPPRSARGPPGRWPSRGWW